jgi:hypothetical protein
LAVAFVLICVAIVHLLTLRPGHAWGDDFAMYILHARNIAEHRPFATTGYIYNPFLPVVGPRSYPPVFPFLLAPAYKLFGLNYIVFKIELVGFLLLFLATAARLLLKYLPPMLGILTLALLGLSPYFSELTNYVGSDLPFAFFFLFTFFLVPSSDENSHNGPWSIFRVFLLGFFVYATVSTRTIGIVWLPVLVLHDLFSRRRVRLATAAVVGISVALLFIQSRVFPGPSSYLDQLTWNLGYIPANLKIYAVSLQHFWFVGIFWIDKPLLVLFLLAVLLGFIGRLRKGIGLPEIVTGVYLVALILWPPADAPRYLIPILPLLALYAAIGLHAAAGRMPSPVHALALVVPVALIGCYVSEYARIPRNAIRGVEDPSAQEVFRFIREGTPQEAVVVFRKPRALSLYTGHRASAYHEPASPAELWSYFRDIGATHLVVCLTMPAGVRDPSDAEYVEYLRKFAVTEAPRLRPVFANGDYEVFELLYPKSS